MDWTLDILIKRFDACVASEAPRKGKEFDEYSSLTEDEQNRLLLETANRFFDDGRYSVKTEWSIEMFELAEACDSLYDLQQIDALTPAQRKRLPFYQKFKALCFPLFRKNILYLREQPFCFKDMMYSIANNELREFLYNTEYIYLAQVMAEGLASQMASGDGATAVAYNELHQYAYYERVDKKKSIEENRTHLNRLIDALWDVHNHYELGGRMGLDHMSQSIYDMTDTFICRNYDYRQVDYAKKVARFIEEGLKRNNNRLNQEFANEIGKVVDETAAHYGVVFADKQYTLRYIFYDLLGFAQPGEEDDNYDLEDDE